MVIKLRIELKDMVRPAQSREGDFFFLLLSTMFCGDSLGCISILKASDTVIHIVFVINQDL